MDLVREHNQKVRKMNKRNREVMERQWSNIQSRSKSKTKPKTKVKYRDKLHGGSTVTFLVPK